MNLLLVQESVTGTDVLNSSIRVEPSVVSLPISVSERFTHILRVHTDMREFPILFSERLDCPCASTRNRETCSELSKASH